MTLLAHETRGRVLLGLVCAETAKATIWPPFECKIIRSVLLFQNPRSFVLDLAVHGIWCDINITRPGNKTVRNS
jgi:hypothetical protein